MITTEQSTEVSPLLDTLPTDEFLLVVGRRVRRQRAEKSMSRKRLAEVSGVSERYLAQLESGQGNMSIALLRKVTTAIGISLGNLMSEQVTETCMDIKAEPSGHRLVGHVNSGTQRNSDSSPVYVAEV